MAGRLQNKVALITGGGAGLDEATAKRFAEEGAVVVVTDINADTASRAADEINASGGQAAARHQDVTDEALWETMVKEIGGDYGALHILVNNAGIGLTGSVEETTVEGIVGEPSAAAYNYSKGGVRIFTKSAAFDESKYMAGSELVIDGGYTCH